MRPRTWFVLVIGVLAGPLPGAGPAGDKAITKDRAAYTGTWRVVSLEVDGNEVRDEYVKRVLVANRADGTGSIRLDGMEISQGTSRIDPTQRPKAIDFAPTLGAEQGPTSLGIYEIRGDTRRLCFAAAGQERPREFATRPGSGHYLVVLKRQKRYMP
jgi:uncharacterized protein (TIGR03067 family)